MGRSQRRREREREARLAMKREHYEIDEGSLSLRHMAASGITPSGNIERLGYEAQMASTPGWRGRRWLQASLVLLLLVFVAMLVLSLVSSLQPGSGLDPRGGTSTDVPQDSPLP
jgi:hypothetical protein